MLGLFYWIFDLMIQKPIVPPPIIFIGCALIMAYLPNPYPLKINVLAVYLIVSVSSVIAFFQPLAIL